MKRVIPMLVLVVATATLSFGQSAGSVEKIITQIENDWGVALVKADAAAIEKILAPGMMFTDAAGTLTSGESSIAGLKSGDAKFDSFKIDELKVVVYGDTAIAYGVDTEKGSYKGKDTSGQYRWTDVYAKIGGQWKAVASHSSLLPKK